MRHDVQAPYIRRQVLRPRLLVCLSQGGPDDGVRVVDKVLDLLQSLTAEERHRVLNTLEGMKT